MVISGLLATSGGYADGNMRYAKEKYGYMKIYSALIGYEYPLSKRTYLYTSAGYTYEKDRDNKVSSVKKNKTFQALAGLVHNF